MPREETRNGELALSLQDTIILIERREPLSETDHAGPLDLDF